MFIQKRMVSGCSLAARVRVRTEHQCEAGRGEEHRERCGVDERGPGPKDDEHAREPEEDAENAAPGEPFAQDDRGEERGPYRGGELEGDDLPEGEVDEAVEPRRLGRKSGPCCGARAGPGRRVRQRFSAEYRRSGARKTRHSTLRKRMTSETEISRVSSRPAIAIAMSDTTAPSIHRAARSTGCGGSGAGHPLELAAGRGRRGAKDNGCGRRRVRALTGTRRQR